MADLLFGHARIFYEEYNNGNIDFRLPDMYTYVANYINIHGYGWVIINLILNIIVLACVICYSILIESMEELFHIQEYETYKEKLIVILKAIVMCVIYWYTQSLFMWSTWINKIENKTLTFEST